MAQDENIKDGILIWCLCDSITGLEYKFMIKSVDPDATTHITGSKNKPKEEMISNRSHLHETRMEEKGEDVEDNAGIVTVPAALNLGGERILKNHTGKKKT